MVVYTAGYPSSVVLDFLFAAARSSSVRFRHWGDADADGVQIWWMLRKRLGKEVHLLRTTGAWTAQAAKRESRRLSLEECGKIERLVAVLESSPESDAADVREALCLLGVVLDSRKWVEQERFYNRDSQGVG